MRAIRAFWLRLGGLLNRRRKDSELAEELESHLQLHTADNLRAGMTAEQARREALLKLGGLELVKQVCRDRRGLPLLEEVAQDLRYAMRTSRKSPGFTAVIVLTIALGTGANTAIFSLVDAVLLRMLPVPHAEQLVFVNTSSVQMGGYRVSGSVSNAQLRQMQQRAKRVAGLAAYATQARLSVGVNGRAEPASGQFVSGSYFPVLGVGARLGRTIGAADDQPANRVAQISYGYWQRRFGGEAGVPGREIAINGVPFRIVGVTAREFYGLSPDTEAEVVIPAATAPQVNAGRVSSEAPLPDAGAGTVFARLREGVTAKEAAAELSVILGQEGAPAAGKLAVELTPASQGVSKVRNRFARPLEVLMVVVGLVMLIACANIANLLLARANARRREIAIRLSLGSSRGRIIRQLLTESLAWSFAGAALGVLLAVWARAGMVYLATAQENARAIPLEWNTRMAAFTAGISILSAFLFGMAPALRATAVDLAPAIKSGGTRHGAGRTRLGRILVVGQVSVSLALLATALLFLGTLRNLEGVDVGFARDHTLLVTLDAPSAGYRGARAGQLYREVLDRVTRVPGVRAASLMHDRFMTSEVSMSSVWVPGYTPRPEEGDKEPWAIANGVGPGFFAASGMRLAAGRDFSERDDEGAPKVAVINETMARHFFGDRNPVGRRIAWSRGEEPSVEIVGVARDIRYGGVRGRTLDVMFTPFLQDPDFWNRATVWIRTAMDPNRVASGVRDAIHGIDSNLPVYDVTTMESQVRATLVQERLMAILASAFGALALALSAVGLYGVLSYRVAQRTGEIGVRMALGAQPGGMVRLVLGETARLVGIGIAIGITLVLGAARLIGSMLFGLSPTDAPSLAGAIAILLAVALVAGFVPARRAARIDPMTALRHE